MRALLRRRRAAHLLVAIGVLAVGACSKGDDAGSAEELCAVLGDGRAYTALFQQGFDPTDTQRALAQLEAASVDLDQLWEAAPADLRDDIDAERAYLDAMDRVIRRVDSDDPAAVVADINALGDERAAAEVASLELRAFARASCGATTEASTDS